MKRQDEHTARLDEHTAKLDELTVTVERHDVFHADLMVFLNQQFAETRRTILDDVKRYLDIVLKTCAATTEHSGNNRGPTEMS